MPCERPFPHPVLLDGSQDNLVQLISDISSVILSFAVCLTSAFERLVPELPKTSQACQLHAGTLHGDTILHICHFVMICINFKVPCTGLVLVCGF